MLACSAWNLSAQILNVAPAIGTPWRYNQVEDLSAQDWTAVSYEDTGGSWLTGPSGFAYETGANDVSHTAPTNTTLIRTALANPTGDGATPRHARYFRLKFNWTGPTEGAVLQLRTRWDDSGVIYLNGQEVFNNTGAMPPLGFVQYTRGAIGGGTEGTVDENASVDVSAMLLQGDNVLAAECHQVNSGSSDIVFVCDATIVVPFAPIITDATQPTNRVVLQHRNTTLAVLATAYPINYQWFKDNNLIPDATNSTYTITDMAPTDAGDYYCEVFNSVGTVNSRAASVVYTDDSIPPTIVRAVGSATMDRITFLFSESMDPAEVTDSFNYSVNPPLSFLAFGVLSADGSSMTLIMNPGSAMEDNTLYTVTVSGVFDLARNPIVETIVQFRSWTTQGCNGLVFEAYGGLSTTDNNLDTTLLVNPNYPNNPRERLIMTAFDTLSVYPDFSHEGYGARMRGLFFPPESGNWVFYLASDDPSRLFLNPNGPDAAGKVLIAQESACCGQWTGHTSLMPAPAGYGRPLPLVAGQGYYIEAIFKEGTGGDYCKVAAALEGQPAPSDNPNQQMSVSVNAIPGSMLGYPAVPAGVAGNVSITQPPANVTAPEGSTATFRVSVTNQFGLPLCYQWQRGNVDIAGAIGASYSFGPTLADDGAVFSVAVSVMGQSPVVSSDATLRVSNDTVGPVVVSVSGDAYGTNVVVTFNEPVATSQDPFNYLINGATVASATRTTPTTVSLVPAAALLGCGADQVVIHDVTDLFNNVMVTNPTNVAFISPLLLVANDAIHPWRYEISGNDLLTAWRAPGYDDSAWGSGPGVLAWEPDNNTPADWPILTTLTDYTSAKITTYFRIHFDLPTAPNTVTRLQLTTVLDDGAAFYLNGQDAFRLRLPDPVLTYNILAGGATEPHPAEGPFDLPTTNLVYGDNVLEVEVHQSSTTSSDIVFGAELIATVSGCQQQVQPPQIGNGSGVVPPPTLSGGTFSVSFQSQTGQSYTLQCNTNLTNPTLWFNIQTSTGNGGVIALQDSGATGLYRFYRIRVP